MGKRELAQAIHKVSYLKGEFTLRSGQTSQEYFDKYRFESQPHLLKAIAVEMRALVPKGTQVLAGLEMGGIPVVTALSIETGLPAIFVLKKAKEYGTFRVAEGLESLKGLQVCMVEDVITTGGQVLLSAEDLRREGALLSHVLCVIARASSGEEKLRAAGLTMTSLFTGDQIKASVD